MSCATNFAWHFNLYYSMGIFSRRQSDDIFLFFLENWIGDIGDNLHETQIPFSRKNKKNISICHLLKFILRVLSVKDYRLLILLLLNC